MRSVFQAANMPSDYRVSITDAEGKEAYSIASFTWLLILRQSRDGNKGKGLPDFRSWMRKDGQREAASRSYAPVPKEVTKKLLTALAIH
jgi:phosphate transport system substrate-binding protein